MSKITISVEPEGNKDGYTYEMVGEVSVTTDKLTSWSGYAHVSTTTVAVVTDREYTVTRIPGRQSKVQQLLSDNVGGLSPDDSRRLAREVLSVLDD